MTYDEITVFRRFLQDKGVLSNFEYFYSAHRYDKIELNYFLEQVEPEGAILRAFDTECAGNSIFGQKYWEDMNKKWLKKLRDFHETGKMDEDIPMTCPHCKRTLPKSSFVVGAKGYHKHCKECESGEWDRRRKEEEKETKELEEKLKEIQRLEKEIKDKQYSMAVKTSALNQIGMNKTTKVCGHCGKRKLRSEFSPSETSEDGLQMYCNKCQNALANVSTQADIAAERKLEKEESKQSAPKLGEYDATLHYKRAQKSITFNSVLSEQIMKGNFTKCYLNTDRQQRLFLIFNNAEGANVSTMMERSNNLACVYSTDICSALASKFHLELDDSYYLHITRNLSRVPGLITIEIIHARTKEEYAAIAKRREEEAKLPQEPSKVVEEKETPVELPESPAEFIQFDFGDKVTAPPKADELLQQLIDRHLASERDIAAFLHKRGWKLQEPVTSYKKFTL